jgi:hypothetical protein
MYGAAEAGEELGFLGSLLLINETFNPQLAEPLSSDRSGVSVEDGNDFRCFEDSIVIPLRDHMSDPFELNIANDVLVYAGVTI